MFTEQQVSFGAQGAIAGIVTVPAYALAAPAVLMLHGFGNQKDEVGDLFKRLAAELAAHDIASLRFDFRGWGESSGDMADTTIEGQVDDAQAAYDYLVAHDSVDPARIGVLGFSLGSVAAVVSAARHPRRYTAMALWSPIADLVADYHASFRQEDLDTAEREGIVTIDLGWRSVTLKHSFFQSMDRFDPREEIRHYDGALLALAGSEDSSATDAPILAEHASGTQKSLVIVEGADHIFNVFDDQSMSNRVIEETAGWFATMFSAD